MNVTSENFFSYSFITVYSPNLNNRNHSRDEVRIYLFIYLLNFVELKYLTYINQISLGRETTTARQLLMLICIDFWRLLLSFSFDWKDISNTRNVFYPVSKHLEVFQMYSFTRRFSTLFSVFGNVVKRGLSCLIFSSKMINKMLRFCLMHVIVPSLTFLIHLCDFPEAKPRVD